MPNPVGSRRLEDRISELCARAVATPDPAEFDSVIQQLRKALREHAKRLRQLAAIKLRQLPIAKLSSAERRNPS
jgi:hypothetical protein